jgi:hypothetical protein
MEKIMEASERTYYARRIDQEEALAASAACDASRIAHRRMANGYRSIIERREPARAAH